jgi:predicted RNA-binding protein YlxR (DUF448 family)
VGRVDGPVRTCVGCGRRRAQVELVRLFVAGGELQLGSGEGRGAYVCPRESCVEKARRSRLLGRSLRARPPIPDDLWSRVRLVSEKPASC